MKISVHYSLSGLALIIIALGFYYAYFLGHKSSKVYTISGTLKKYSTERVRKGHEAHFKLYEYPNDFVISKGEIKSFDEEAFEIVTTEGLPIIIKLEKEDKISMKNGGDVSILQISDGNRSYINEKVYWEMRNTSSYAMLCLALFFGGVGLYQFVTIEKKIKSS